jgi:hypothetical protein
MPYNFLPVPILINDFRDLDNLTLFQVDLLDQLSRHWMKHLSKFLDPRSETTELKLFYLGRYFTY